MKEALQRLGRRELEREGSNRTSWALPVRAPRSRQPAGQQSPLLPLKGHRKQSHTSAHPRAHTHLRMEPLQAWQGDAKGQRYTYSLCAAPGPKAKGTSRKAKVTAGRREGFPDSGSRPTARTRGGAGGPARHIQPPLHSGPSRLCSSVRHASFSNQTPTPNPQPRALLTSATPHRGGSQLPWAGRSAVYTAVCLRHSVILRLGMSGILYQRPPAACWTQMDWGELSAQLFILQC